MGPALGKRANWGEAPPGRDEVNPCQPIGTWNQSDVRGIGPGLDHSPFKGTGTIVRFHVDWWEVDWFLVNVRP